MLRPLLLVPLALLVASCGSEPPPSSGPTVVAAFYPLAYAAQSVAPAGTTVTVLTPPGVEPHDIELSPQQVATVADADLVLYIPGFQPALDAALEGRSNAVDVTAGITMIGEDPHVWLDPLNMVAIGRIIESRLPGSNAVDFDAQMNAINAQWRAGTATCAQRTLVVSHDAFAYLAEAYDFTQVGIAGLSPDAEPSPERLAEIAQLVSSQGVTTIYYETLVDPKVAETVAAETGATTAVLDPLEGLPEGYDGDYVTVMLDNLAQVTAGQECS